MPRKKHKAEEIVAKLRQVDVLLSQGRSVGEAVRSIGVTQFTYYRWRHAGPHISSASPRLSLHLQRKRDSFNEPEGDHVHSHSHFH
jgi:hypothetical protein